MKKIKIIFKQFLTFIIALSLSMNTACKKENSDKVISLLPSQRIIEIYELQDGVEEYKETYKYEGEQLVGNNFFLYNEEGEWHLWAKYTFEYPFNNVIIQKRFAGSDTLVTPTSEWHKKFSGDQLTEMIYYRSGEEILEPFGKITWTYEQGRLMESLRFEYENNEWLPEHKYVNFYENNNWVRSESYRYNEGNWNFFYKTEIKYNNGLAIEMNGYEFIEYTSLWHLNEHYKMDYSGGMLTAMHCYDPYNDTLRWDYSILVTYNESSNPATYTIQNDNGPEEVLYLTYEDGKGNFKQATAYNSGYDLWPWLPSPVKGTGSSDASFSGYHRLLRYSKD